MKKLWKKQLPAAALALIMMISLVPLAGAEEAISLSHTHSTTKTEWEKDATHHWKVCETDHQEFDRAEHNFTETSKQEPTCYQPGKIVETCSVCQYSRTTNSDATGSHNYSSVWTSNDEHHWHACLTNGCPSTSDKATHQPIGDGKLTPATCTTDGYITYSCRVCQRTYTKPGEKALNHIDSNNDGICDRPGCGASVGTAYTVTFQTPAGSSVISNQTVLAGQRPKAVSNPSSFTSGGITYTFYGWMQGASSNYVYTGQQTVTPSNVTISGNTVFTALYKTNGYTVTFQSLTSYGGTTSSTQTVAYNGYPTNPSTPYPVTFGGKVYTFKGWVAGTPYGNSWYLYQSNYHTLVNPSSQRITNNTNFYAVYTTNDSATITYSADPGKETSFDSRDFYNAYRNQASGTLSYVTFSLDRSTYNGFEGDIYLDNSVLSYSDLTNSRFYYDPGRNEYDLDDLSLVADKNDDDDSITLNFTAYGTSWGQQVSGTVKLVVGDEEISGDTIPYKVAPGKTVDFDRRDFDTVFRNHYPSDTLGYVVFDRPDSDAFDHGTLYSEYGSSSRQVKFTRNDLDDAYFYYNGSYATGRSDYELDELTFVADSNFKETITLTFTAYALNNTSRYVEGEVRIRSTEAGVTGDITYKVAPGKSYTVSRTDFLNFLRKSYSNETLEYVIFDKPDSSAFTNATLYSGYNTSKQVLFTRNDLNDAYFYYNASDATGRRDYALDSLTFVADSGFKEAVELSFTAYDDDSDYVTGTLVFQPDGAAAGTSNYVGSVRYAAAAGNNVQINANDLARYYQKATGGTLQYVTFTGAPSAGGLYYNYYGASKYGSPTRLQLTAGSSQSFYLNPTSTAQYALTELTYVPSGSNYCASIPFVAYGTNYASVSGAILISVSRSAVSEIYGTTLRNTAVSFPASGIYSAVLSATGSALYSIQLLSLPASNQGTVYVGSGTANRANTTSQYTYASGVNAISQLRFVPAASYTGSVEIPYVALNSSGVAIASGVFSIGVVNTRRSYTDVTSSTWCYKYVTELADAGVISGYKDGSFKPASTISYGAALKLVMRAAGYPELAPTNKTSVFSGYLARAQADGLVTRSNINLAAPITRLQVAQLAAGALKLSTSNLSSVKPFTDTSDLYVQALNAAGIVEGYFSNGTSTFRPNSTLNRGQVSAIVWRMQNYRK